MAVSVPRGLACMLIHLGLPTRAPLRLPDRLDAFLPLLGMLKKAASGVLALLPCSRTGSTLRASKRLQHCWTNFFEHSLSLMSVAVLKHLWPIGMKYSTVPSWSKSERDCRLPRRLHPSYYLYHSIWKGGGGETWTDGYILIGSSPNRVGKSETLGLEKGNQGKGIRCFT